MSLGEQAHPILWVGDVKKRRSRDPVLDENGNVYDVKSAHLLFPVLVIFQISSLQPNI